MGDELASAIAATQEQLGGLFQKPKLSEKLLSKAPFRFLHDVVTAVTASTGFAAGLYSGEELDSGAIKDKTSKIAYLNKLVALVGICSGHDIPTRPSKVVAGLEPEGTNALLTALGKCARSTSLDFDEAVRRALSGEAPGSRPPPVRTDGDAPANPGTKGGSLGAGVPAEDKNAGVRHDSGSSRRRSSSGNPPGEAGGGDGRRASASSAAGGDEKASAKQEMEAMGAAAKAMGMPQSRRIASRAGAARADSKSANLGADGLGEEASGVGGRDLAGAIEACTGEIGVTRQMLEPIISRPKLSDKLLNMPPFRFLHDIVSEVTRQTGFGRGLYSDEEQDSSLVKAKPAKMAYLDKLIMLVGMSLNTLVDARPAKIVAGLEAENTNRLLQLLALAAVQRPDSSRAVAAVLGSEASSAERRRSSESVRGAGRDTTSALGDADKQPTQQQQQQQQQQQRPERRASNGHEDGQPAAPADEREGSRASSASEAKAVVGTQEQPVEDKAGPGSATQSRNRSESDMSQQPPHEEAAGEEPTRSMRPRTARRRPPAVRDNTKEFTDKGRGQSLDDSRAPPKVASIMMDGDDDKESDDEETEAPGFGLAAAGGDIGGGGAGAKAEAGHTAMVADILKEKKLAEDRAREAGAEAKAKGDGQGRQERKGSSDGGGAGGGGIRMGRLRRSGSSSAASSAANANSSRSAGGLGGGYGDADVSKVKDAIQTLCQSTHPLGKCLDFVHEDLSLMAQEMDRWRAVHKAKAEALKGEREATEIFLQPLRLQLRDVGDQLKESTTKIHGVKASINMNERRINSLLKMVVSS